MENLEIVEVINFFFIGELNSQQKSSSCPIKIQLGLLDAQSPSMHGNKEYAYSPDLPGRVVKGD